MFPVQDGLSSFVSTLLHQTPRRGVTGMAGTKGPVLLRVLSGVADLAPHMVCLEPICKYK